MSQNASQIGGQVTLSVQGVLDAALPAPQPALAVANVTEWPKLSEKTIELTTSSQFGSYFCCYHRFGLPGMVWFGLTQRQERQWGFDAATDLGGRAFILQFKVSSQVMQSGPYVNTRKFSLSHEQMYTLRERCQGGLWYYFLPDIGTVDELSRNHCDLLRHSFLLDVASLPSPIPTTQRRNGCHYLYLDSANKKATITSDPVELNNLTLATDFANALRRGERPGSPEGRSVIDIARELDRDDRFSQSIFRNSALVVMRE